MNRIAEKLARKVHSRRQRHSCLILKGGRILSQANNEKGHAEQLALGIYVSKDSLLANSNIYYRSLVDPEQIKIFKGAVLISFRLAPNGSIGKSKPCVACSLAIKEAGIRKVIYFDGKIWKEEYR